MKLCVPGMSPLAAVELCPCLPAATPAHALACLLFPCTCRAECVDCLQTPMGRAPILARQPDPGEAAPTRAPRRGLWERMNRPRSRPSSVEATQGLLPENRGFLGPASPTVGGTAPAPHQPALLDGQWEQTAAPCRNCCQGFPGGQQPSPQKPSHVSGVEKPGFPGPHPHFCCSRIQVFPKTPEELVCLSQAETLPCPEDTCEE